MDEGVSVDEGAGACGKEEHEDAGMSAKSYKTNKHDRSGRCAREFNT